MTDLDAIRARHGGPGIWACGGPASPQTYHEGPNLDCPECGRESAEFIANAPADIAALLAEVDRLHSWDGLMELLDEHWPADIFPTLPDDDSRDPGPRIVSLLRWVDRLVVERDVATAWTKSAVAERNRLREALRPFAADWIDDYADSAENVGADLISPGLPVQAFRAARKALDGDAS